MTLPHARTRVTILTPSFQQARFLAATLRSVAMQDYPDIEHIVVDGGSTDGTIELLAGWREHQIAWISEPDRGQADAIEKGIARSTGDIIAWLNSDDVYLDRQVVSDVVRHFDAGARIVTGGGRHIDAGGGLIHEIPVRARLVTHRATVAVDYLLQPATFVARDIHLACPMDLDLHYAFDWDFFIRATRMAEPVVLNRPIAGYRLHGTGKSETGGGPRRRELALVTRRYQGVSLRFVALVSSNAVQDALDRLPPGPARAGRRLVGLAHRGLRWLDGGVGIPT